MGRDDVREDDSYFVAEKQESLLFMAAGVLAVAVAIWLYANGHRLWQRHNIAAGVGAGLVLQAAFMLCLDLFAEARGGGLSRRAARLAGMTEPAFTGGERIARGLAKLFVRVCLLMASLSAFAGDPSEAKPKGPTRDQESAGRTDDAVDSSARPIVLAGTPVLTSYGLLAQLQGYLRQRDVDANSLTAAAMVRLMIDWFRFAPIDPVGGTPSADALVYRYGGWSEGCATAFKLSLLRRVSGRNAIDGTTELLAGITLMFEPSGQAELMPFTTASSDWKSLNAFLDAIESSPAFRGLGAATPMAVVLESGGLR